MQKKTQILSNLKRVAAEHPETRKHLVPLLKKAGTPTPEEVAAWALWSYPETGDAAFLVHRTPAVMGGMAAHFFEGLRGYFISRPFIRRIQSQLAEMKGEIATSIETQEQAVEIWGKKAEEFLFAMFKAHRNGKQKFGENGRAIEAWIKRNVRI